MEVHNYCALGENEKFTVKICVGFTKYLPKNVSVNVEKYHCLTQSQFLRRNHHFFRQINVFTKDVTKELISRKFLSVLNIFEGVYISVISTHFGVPLHNLKYVKSVFVHLTVIDIKSVAEKSANFVTVVQFLLHT